MQDTRSLTCDAESRDELDAGGGDTSGALDVVVVVAGSRCAGKYSARPHTSTVRDRAVRHLSSTLMCVASAGRTDWSASVSCSAERFFACCIHSNDEPKSGGGGSTTTRSRGSA